MIECGFFNSIDGDRKYNFAILKKSIFVESNCRE